MRRPWWRRALTWLAGRPEPERTWPPTDPDAYAAVWVDQLEAFLRDVAEGRRTP